jgi:two-component system sensor histidine kinase KdpD
MTRSNAAIAYALTFAAVAAATLGAILVDASLGAPNASMVLVLPVVLAAAFYGWGPALAAAVAGVVAYNFFLIEPRYSLRVADPSNLWALLLLLATAAVVSVVAAESRRRAIAAQEAADRAIALQSLARTLVGAGSRPEIAQCCAEALGRLFGAPAAILLEREGGGLDTIGLSSGARLSPADEEAARWTLATRQAARGGAYPADDADFDFWPVVTRTRQAAVIGVRLANLDPGRPEAPERFVQIVEGYLSVALDREAYARSAREREVQAAGERLKSDLLAAVSHDLRTPLSTILVTLQSLRKFDRSHDAATRAELLAGAEAEASRLGRMVENLLDMSRIEAGAVAVRASAVDAVDLVAAALERAAPALSGHEVLNEAGAGGARMAVDAGLMEAALANLLENAGKYSNAGSPVRIRAGKDDGMGWIEVLDEGPGFDRPPEALFGKFQRGREGDGRPPGLGLGLAIAESFLNAQGGWIEASNRKDGSGARVRLVAPLAATAT